MPCLFFTAPLCESSVNYLLSWLFFLILSGCIISMIFQYPFTRDNKDEPMTRFLFSMLVTLLIGLVARGACVNDYQDIRDSKENISEKEYLLL